MARFYTSSKAERNLTFILNFYKTAVSEQMFFLKKKSLHLIACTTSNDDHHETANLVYR